jgi:hypothetical protein
MLHAKQSRSNYKLLHVWRECEGGNASYNPLNTTEPWPGATNYNSVGVKNYPTGKAGIQATYTTLVNGHYNGIVGGLKKGTPARTIVGVNQKEFDTWGTGTTCILRSL